MAAKTQQIVTARIPSAQYARAIVAVKKQQQTDPDFLMADFFREGFSRELDRRSSGPSKITSFSTKELAAQITVLAPGEVDGVRKLLAMDPSLTVRDFLHEAIANEVSRRTLSKRSVKPSLETISKQLEQLAILVGSDRQQNKTTALLTGLIATEIGVATDPASAPGI